MQKLGIDEINTHGKKGILPPGPGNYEMQKSFGTAGKQIAFSPRLPYDTIALRRQSKSPGPGQYATPEVLGQGITSSTIPNGVG